MVRRTSCALFVCFGLLADDAAADDVVDVAASLIGRPYVWGAEGPNAFDCSGLTHYVFQQIGLQIPRRAVQQSAFGDRINRLQRGDLVFFSTDTRRSLVTHVGIYEGGGVMIDASKSHGRVRRDNLREEYWTARYMGARRVTADIDGGVGQPPERRRGGRREAARALGRLAEALLRRRW